MSNERYRIELNSEAPNNPPQWVELQHGVTGKRFRYVEKSAAETAKEELLAVQPHLRTRLRIAGI